MAEAAEASGERYARHKLIPGWNQARLQSAKIIVVGVGALGSECARLLAQAGIGAMILCDPDVVSLSNLSRGALYGRQDVGRPKVEAAAEILTDLAPSLACEPREAGLVRGVGLAELRDATLVISALDSIAGRVRLATRCNLVGAGLLDGGTHPWGGEVRYYAPGDACYACGLTTDERAVQDDPWTCGVVTNTPEHGASAPVSALVGSWLATAALRTVLGLDVPRGTVRVEPSSGWAGRVAVKADPECPLHDGIVGPVNRVELGADHAVRDLLALLGPGEIAMTWASVTGDENPLRSSYLLSDARPDAPLREVGIAPRELLPIFGGPPPSRVVRYLELAATANGAAR